MMKPQLHVLLIEDNEEHASIIARHIRRASGASVRLVHEERLSSALKRLLTDQFDAILLDLRLPDSDIGSTLPATLKASRDIPIVVLSSLEDRETALKSVHEGAQDYLFKGALSSDLLIRAIYAAMERKQVEARLKTQVRQKQALFDLSQMALNENKLDGILSKAVEIVARSLDVPLAGVLELLPNREMLKLKSGIGWETGGIALESVRIAADRSSLAGYTILSSQAAVGEELKGHKPVVVSSLSRDTRFDEAPFLKMNGVESGMCVLIHGSDPAKPYGVLGCFAKSSRVFSADEADFLQAVANTLGATILRHQLEEELNRRIRELDVAHRRKDEFLATLSHELRTPLSVISGYVDILKNAKAETPEFAEALNAIERNTQLETQLISDTISVSRIITGKMMIEPTSFVFENVIESAIEAVQFGASAKGIQIEVRLDRERHDFFGDENKIRQLIWNLLSNAVKFTPQGGRITIELNKVDSVMKLVVRDTGRGIEPASLAHVFERFWQEDSGINRRYMGLGLGLAIVRHIVDLHGGTVFVESEGRDKGAGFTVCLPFREAEQDVRSENGTSYQNGNKKVLLQTNEYRSFDGRRVLLIDDSPDSLLVVSRLLQKMGAQVKACSSPAEGLTQAKSGDYDVVVSDIGMPDIDGYELMRRLRQHEDLSSKRHVPALALTAHVTQADVSKAIESGFQEHLAKPVNLATLEASLNRLLPEVKPLH